MKFISRKHQDNGRNFTAITCDSCKSFFRRTALKNKTWDQIIDNNSMLYPMVSMFNEDCNETDVTDNSITDNTVAINSVSEIQSSFPLIPIFKSLTDYNGLNQLESNRILELFNASRVIDANFPTPKNVVNITDSKVLLRFSGSIAEEHIKNIVTFLKGINGFKEMCKHDQFAITKSVSFNLMLARFWSQFDSLSNSYIMPLDLQNAICIQLGLWSQGTDNNVMETNLKQFLARFVSLVQKDVTRTTTCWSESEAQTRLQNLINYGSITCKSCRVFFWRAITNNKVLKCPSKGMCSIDKAFRSICPNCRLNKCFTVGMKKEFIKSEEQNETNCQLNATINRKGVDCTDIIEFKNNDNNNNFDEIEDLITETLNISTDGLEEQMNEIENCLQTNCMDTNNKLISLKHGKNKCQDSALMPIIPVLTDHKGWNQMETIKLSELLTSSHVFSYPMADTRHIIRDKIEFFRVLSQYTENSISDVVKFTKGLNGFTNISAADQYILIKHGCFELLALRYLVYYDHQWDRDPIIMDLLTAIILFNPSRPMLIHNHYVKLEQQLYIYLLQRYLLLKYRSESESQRKVQHLMQSLTHLKRIAKSKVPFELNASSQNYGQLTCESCKMFFRRICFKAK
ncbi:unnamed protein product, partial [Medioppia subpectinata]